MDALYEVLLFITTVVVIVIGIYVMYYPSPPVTGKKKKTTKIVEEKKTYFTVSDIEKHNTQDDCWLIIDDKVYDVTSYVEDHVGGPESISKLAGLDNTKGFHGKQHPDKVTQMIEEYFIGYVKKD